MKDALTLMQHFPITTTVMTVEKDEDTIYFSINDGYSEATIGLDAENLKELAEYLTNELKPLSND